MNKIDDDYENCIDGRFHCDHWLDGDKCCRCGAPEMTYEEKEAQGMV